MGLGAGEGGKGMTGPILIKCQFCPYQDRRRDWLNKGFTCPQSRRDYDYQLAQDSEK